MVGILFTRYFDTSIVIKPGNVVKLLLSMTLSYVLFQRKKHIVCKNRTSSYFEYIVSRTADAALVVVVRFDIRDLGID